MTKRRKIVLVLAAVIIVLAAAIGISITIVERNLEQLQFATVSNIDLLQIPDGTFTGSYSSFPVSAKVDVTVKNHEIVSIDLIQHMNGQGGEADVIPEHVVQAQSLLIDSVAGATYSSKVILLAIEDALLRAGT